MNRENILKNYGILQNMMPTGAEFMVLNLLRDHLEGLTARQISEHLNKDLGWTQVILKRLIDKDWIVTDTVANDTGRKVKGYFLKQDDDEVI